MPHSSCTLVSTRSSLGGGGPTATRVVRGSAATIPLSDSPASARATISLPTYTSAACGSSSSFGSLHRTKGMSLEVASPRTQPHLSSSSGNPAKHRTKHASTSVCGDAAATMVCRRITRDTSSRPHSVRGNTRIKLGRQKSACGHWPSRAGWEADGNPRMQCYD
eukprot:scaffold59785_cov63-Phaeocystis_antarctica.AAC.2